MENTILRRFTNICVFCGSSSGKNKEFEEAAEQFVLDFIYIRMNWFRYSYCLFAYCWIFIGLTYVFFFLFLFSINMLFLFSINMLILFS
ncbi:hypothetical protein ACOSP7_005231 [Xanthoceras sorbifolium]